MMRASQPQIGAAAARPPRAEASWSALFSYGFRPFFLLAAGWAVLALLTLVGALMLGAWPSDALPLARWQSKSTTKATEGLYTYDTVKRLHDSRFGGGAVSETLGRAVFGLGAGLTWLFVITLGVVGLRRLGRR